MRKWGAPVTRQAREAQVEFTRHDLAHYLGISFSRATEELEKMGQVVRGPDEPVYMRLVDGLCGKYGKWSPFS